jgi:hypothetical protein
MPPHHKQSPATLFIWSDSAVPKKDVLTDENSASGSGSASLRFFDIAETAAVQLSFDLASGGSLTAELPSRSGWPSANDKV